jgi:hypothetical protein
MLLAAARTNTTVTVAVSSAHCFDLFCCLRARSSGDDMACSSATMTNAVALTFDLFCCLRAGAGTDDMA